MKQYCIFEKEYDGKFARLGTHPTRKEATDALSKIFSNNPNADPQNFKIVEQTIEAQTEFEKLLDRLMERLAHFSSKFTLGEKGMTSDGRECIRLLIGDGIDIWTNTAIRAIMDVLEDKVTFGIALSPINNKVEMLIMDSKQVLD